MFRRRQRRRFVLRFSLSTLAIVAAAFCVLLAYLAYQVNRAEQQRAAALKITELGGGVSYHTHIHFHGVRQFRHDKPHPSRGPKWLRDWLGPDFFQPVVHVSLDMIPEEKISLELLNGLADLRELSAQKLTVGDDYLTEIGRLRRLRELYLGGCPITDEGVARLRNLKNLEVLDLQQTRITDVAFNHLKSLGSLQKLNVTRTDVTEAGIAEFRRSVPNCDVIAISK